MSTVLTKVSIINELLTKKIITIECASRILTRTDDWIRDVCDLHNDGAIDDMESIRILTEPGYWGSVNLDSEPIEYKQQK